MNDVKLVFKICFVFFLLFTPFRAVYADKCIPNHDKPESHFIGLGTHAVDSSAYYQHVDELPVQWVRVEYHWKYIEQQQGKFSWEAYDNITKNLLRSNKKILAIISHPPEWSYSNRENFIKNFTVFAHMIAKRYGRDGLFITDSGLKSYIRYWEIFNEPNLPGYGWPFKDLNENANVDLYVQALKQGNISIRKADPTSFLMNGGLSPDGVHPKIYATKMLSQIDKDCFDIFAYHPYGNIENIPNIQLEIKDLLEMTNHKDKTIWFTEFGTNHDELRQDMLKKLKTFHDEGKIDTLFWFSLRDLKFFGYNFGLLEYDWSKKEHYQQFINLFQPRTKSK